MKKLIAIDPGHGMNTPGKRTPPFPGGTVMREREFNTAVAGYLIPLLVSAGFDVLNVAESDTDVQLATRTGLANNKVKNSFNRPVDLYLSIHANASGGDGSTFDNAEGIESYVYTLVSQGGQTERWASIIHKQLIAATGRRNRGLKRADFHVLRETSMPAVLVECGFMTNLAEATLLRTEVYRRRVADGLAAGIREVFGVQAEEPLTPDPAGTPIIGRPTASIEQLAQWAADKNAKPFFIALAPTFYKVALAAGVDSAVVYCQSAKETGYGKFGGVIDESYCNPCGMKNSAGGGDADPNAHKRFDSWEQGIQAQVDHLALYAGADGYPKSVTLDPRHFSYLHGTARTVEALGGKWAPSASYGMDITRMMVDVWNTVVKVPAPPVAPPASDLDTPSAWELEQAAATKWGKENGITDGRRPQDTCTRVEMWAMLMRFFKLICKMIGK